LEAAARAVTAPSGRRHDVHPPETTSLGGAESAATSHRKRSRSSYESPFRRLPARPATQCFGETTGPLRGFSVSFRVTFTDSAQRVVRRAATQVIQNTLCSWASKQKHGLTLDVRETSESLEGIIEGVHNGNVTADTLADVRKRLYRMLRKAKDSAERRVWKCDYNTAVFDEYAKPEEMVTSWIVRNGSRPGYERLQTTHPDVVEFHQHEAAATVSARDTPAASSGARPPSGMIHSLSDLIAAVEAERGCVQNQVAQISSFKDAMVCVGDVVQGMEVLYKFLRERALLEEGGVGLEAASFGMVAQGSAAGRSNPSGSLPKSLATPSPAAAIAGPHSPKQSPKLLVAFT